MTGRRTGTRDLGRPDVVGRLLRSMAFRRSREASTAILDDAQELRGLTESVRGRGYADGALEPVADQIDAALHLLDDRADQLDGGSGPARLAPAKAARHRLVVAAMHYLARRDDVIRDDTANGEIDDIVVVREVLETAGSCLAPYQDDDPAAGSPAASVDDPPRLDPQSEARTIAVPEASPGEGGSPESGQGPNASNE